MRPRQESTPLPVWIAIFLAAGAVQWPLFAFFKHTATQERDFEVKARKRAVEVSVTKWRPRLVRKEREKPSEDAITGTVVTVRPPEREMPPPQRARYLSQYDTRTKKEVKARPSPDRHSRAGVAAKATSKIQSPRSSSVAETASPKVDPEKVELPTKRTKATPHEDGSARPQSELLRSERSVALAPTVDRKSAIANIQAITGGSFSDDALLDVEEEGAQTVLNTRKFQYWEFFDTVKSRVRKHWNPAQAYRKRDPTGKVYGIKDRLTIVKVTLDSGGRLQRLTTVKNCGVDFLDVEARKALRKAAPFVNPPAGLVDRHGAIVFQFGFLFEISSSRFKFFRVPM